MSNLGVETSAPVAAALAKAGTSFIFATGYGEATAFLGDYPDAPVINKPYGVNQVQGALARLARA